VTPEATRLFFAAGISMIVGGVIGSYVTGLVYGDSPGEIDPVTPRQKICPPCECPACPPPPSCGDLNGVPTSTAPRAILVPEDEEVDRDKKPGLPASAVQLATSKVRAEVASCFANLPFEVHGTILLDLTVTATGSQGFISDASMIEKSDDVVSSSELEHCLVDAARRTKFEWNAEDGEAHVRLPIALKKP
jgi:hypothetical protein